MSIHNEIHEQDAEQEFQTSLKVAVTPTQIILLNVALNYIVLLNKSSTLLPVASNSNSDEYKCL